MHAPQLFVNVLYKYFPSFNHSYIQTYIHKIFSQQLALYLIKRIWTWNDLLLGRSKWQNILWICNIALVIHGFLVPFNCHPVWTFDASLMERCVRYCVFSQRWSRWSNFLENKPQNLCFIKLEVLAFVKLEVLAFVKWEVLAVVKLEFLPVLISHIDIIQKMN